MTPGFIKYQRSLHEELMKLSHDEHVAFLDLLTTANYETTTTPRGDIVNRGQVLSSYAALANRWNVSIKRVRTILKTLRDTGLVTVSGTGQGKGRGTLLTVDNYAFTQGVGHSFGHETGQESGHDLGQPLNNTKKCEEDEESFSPFKHPSLTDIQNYDRLKDLHRDPVAFYNYHEPNWTDGNGQPIYDWRRYYARWTNPGNKKVDLSAQIDRVFGGGQ